MFDKWRPNCWNPNLEIVVPCSPYCSKPRGKRVEEDWSHFKRQKKQSEGPTEYTYITYPIEMPQMLIAGIPL